MQHFGGVDPSGYCYNAWRPNPVTTTSKECEVESKIVREVITAATVDWQPNESDHSLERHDLPKALRVCAWIAWFIHNFRQVLWKRWTCEYATTVSESAGQKPLGSVM